MGQSYKLLGNLSECHFLPPLNRNHCMGHYFLQLYTNVFSYQDYPYTHYQYNKKIYQFPNISKFLYVLSYWGNATGYLWTKLSFILLGYLFPINNKSICTSLPMLGISSSPSSISILGITISLILCSMQIILCNSFFQSWSEQTVSIIFKPRPSFSIMINLGKSISSYTPTG